MILLAGGASAFEQGLGVGQKLWEELAEKMKQNDIPEDTVNRYQVFVLRSWASATHSSPRMEASSSSLVDFPLLPTSEQVSYRPLD